MVANYTAQFPAEWGSTASTGVVTDGWCWNITFPTRPENVQHQHQHHSMTGASLTPENPLGPPLPPWRNMRGSNRNKSSTSACGVSALVPGPHTPRHVPRGHRHVDGHHRRQLILAPVLRQSDVISQAQRLHRLPRAQDKSCTSKWRQDSSYTS
jgi:hypothetical protein